MGLVYVADTESLIGPDMLRMIVEDGEHEVLRRARASTTEAHNLAGQARALQYIAQPPEMPLDRAVLFYGGLRDGTTDIPNEIANDVREFRDRVFAASLRMAAINSFVIRPPADLVGRAVSRQFGVGQHIRATVHAKAGEIRPHLRRPNELDSPGLLPMHGLAFRVKTVNGETRWGMTFAIDARMRGWTAVFDESEHFRHFEAVSVKTGN